MLINLEKDSRYQEQIVEYKFVSELMIALAYMGKKLEVLRVHTDSFGYDLILKVDEIVRYIQLKSRSLTGKAQYWDVHKSLLQNNNGVVLVIFYSFQNDDLELNYKYLDPSKYTSTLDAPPKNKKDPTRYCQVAAKNLIKINTISELAKTIFVSA